MKPHRNLLGRAKILLDLEELTKSPKSLLLEPSVANKVQEGLFKPSM